MPTSDQTSAGALAASAPTSASSVIGVPPSVQAAVARDTELLNAGLMNIAREAAIAMLWVCLAIVLVTILKGLSRRRRQPRKWDDKHR